MHKIKMGGRAKRRLPRQLGLAAKGGRGGWRAGAGRPRGRSAHYVPHVPRPRLSRHHPVHVTLRLRDDAPDLHEPSTVPVIEGIFRAERQGKGFRLVHYSIRPNHLHLVCEAEGRVALSRGIQRLASRVARAVNRRVGRVGRFFADRFHQHVLRAPRQVHHVLRYVLLNAHKDAARSGVRLMGIDPQSSGWYFDGWADACPRPPPRELWPVAPPGTWLLQKGWRRHGLIRTDEKAPSPGRA
jgi:REP element-mobilizing transposase RayT